MIPCELCRDKENEQPFCGINGSRLKIDGAFFGRLEVSGVQVEIQFYVVPDNTMAFDILLGRDFLNCSQLHVTFCEGIKIAGAEETRTIDSLMHIDYGDGSVRSRDELRINPAIGEDVSARICEAYESHYFKKMRAEKNASDYEMIIALKHEQPISSQPHRLSFADKKTLREILDDLLKRTIIRQSNSPYASPIVLVRKKNGGCRLCVHYREINKIIVREFPNRANRR